MDAHVGGSPLRQHLNGSIAPDGGGLRHAPFCLVSGVGECFTSCPLGSAAARSHRTRLVSHSLLSVAASPCFEANCLHIRFTQQRTESRVSLIPYIKTKHPTAMVFWQPVVYFRELDNGEKAYYCHEVFRDPDNAKAHGYDVADKMAENMDRQVVTKRVILDDNTEQ